MTPKSRLSLQVRQAILGYMSGRLDAAAISTASAMQAVRQQVPTCLLKDKELTDLIAETALEAGFGVSFERFDNDNAEAEE